jgi:hypothetical protein
MEHHVFLSYSHKDMAIMRRVRDDLRAGGLRVWNDENLMPGTPSWKNGIEKAIENAGCLVVILSPDAKESEWIERELDYARTCGVPILPVLAAGDERSAIPFELINVQRIDTRADYAAGIQHLTASVRDTMVSRDDLQTPAQPTAHSHGLPPMDRQALDAWNLLDQLRLMQWLFLSPARVVEYEARRGEESVRQVGAWLVSTLAWLPLVIPTLAYSLGTIPVMGSARLSLFFVWILFIVALLATGWLNMRGSQLASVLAFIIAAVVTLFVYVLVGGVDSIELAPNTPSRVAITMTLGVACGVAFSVARRAAGTVIGIVAGIVMFIALFNRTLGPEAGLAGIGLIGMTLGVTFSLESGLRTGQLSWLNWGIIAASLLAYAAMVWIYFLGGWSLLAA